MKKIIPLLSLVLFLSACSAEDWVFPDAICIENITTVDAQSGATPGQTVVIREGKIIKVAATESLVLSSRNTIIDGTGKYLMPGLWDAHVHFAYIEELAPAMNDLFLAYGITSLRDTGGEINFMRKWKKNSQKKPTTTPRLMIAGPLLDGMPNVYDGSSPGRPPLSHGLATVADVNEYVDYLDSLGVDLLKAYEMLSPEQFNAVMVKAKEKGLKVTGHVPLSMDVVSVADAGINSLEHLRNIEMSMAKNAGQLLQKRQQMLSNGKDMQGGDLRSSIHQAQRVAAINDPDETNTQRVIEALARNKTVQVPTLALSKIPAFKEFTQPEWQESYGYLPDSIEARWQRQMERVKAAPDNIMRQKHFEWALKMIGKMHQEGIPIMAGTDTPIGFLTPGLSLHAELELFVDAGLSAQEALASATTEPAKYFDMELELGLIEEGMWADLLILTANPLENISNARQIETVIKAGNVMDRAEMLRKLK